MDNRRPRPRPKFTGSNPLGGDTSPTTPMSPIKADSAIYSANKLEIAPSGNIVANPISLADISPNRLQPRRIIPLRLLDGWQGELEGAQGVFNRWHQEAEDILGKPIDVLAIVKKQSVLTEDDPQIPPGIAQDFIEELQLAGEILRDGLTHPITVVGNRPPYIIETGERRWLAYHILWLLTDDLRWTSIPAVIQDKNGSVWRTASENGARQNLNAIAKARQLAILVMHLNQARYEYLPYEAFEHDREYYAQVADGNIHKIPTDSAQAVSDATGLNGYARISQFRRVLNLTNEVWDLADEQNWKEEKIRLYLAGTLKNFKVDSPTPPTENPYMNEFWMSYSRISKKHTQIAGRVGEAERRQMADALRKLADDLEKNRK